MHKFWRKKTPTVIQMEAVECGAASLGIILGYWGRFLPLEQLREDCAVSRDGSNAFNVIKAAKKYGLEAKGFQKTAAEIEEIGSPCIVLWEFNHFLVVEGIGKDKVFLNDPAVGPLSVTHQEFEEGYSGIVLTFNPTEEFQTGGAPLSLWQEFHARLKHVSSSLVYLFIAGLCLIVPGLFLAAFLRIFLDYIAAFNMQSAGSIFLLSIGSIILIGGLLMWLQRHILMRLNGRLSIEFSGKFLWHLLRLPVMFYTQRYPGEVAYRTNLNNTVATQMTGPIATTSIDLLLIFFYGLAMLMYDWTIGLIGWGALLANLGVFLWIQRLRADAYTRLQQEYGKWIGSSLGALQNIETIKATGMEADFFARYAGYYAKNQSAYQEIGKRDAVLGTIPVLLQGLSLAAVLSIGSLRILSGTMTFGQLMALQALMISFLLPISRFINFGQMMQTAKTDVNRLNDTMRSQIDPIYFSRKENAQKDGFKLKGCLEFKNVTFGYDRSKDPLLDALSFKIEPGKRLALVGPSGCGKSTIAKLAVGLYQPWSGEITVDGRPLTEISVEEFTHSISHVDQEIFLFSGTIRENLSLWNQTVTDEMLIEAAKDAGIHDEILLRENGYHSLLMERGRNLSGGQKQRLEIARALLYRPSLLVMDEATSALDSEREKMVSDRIRKRGCSVLSIAHRLSTIQDCDEILVLQKGKVVQRGTHEALKQEPGIYKGLIESEGAIHV
ncbi:MAG: NHLP family bacteriocin export ABC transporter peptidase/permease/ATPase subunit [Verrucomicrobia bacterium]|nr:NHLP family bacteriocin export ABC transporter peptidase/permease/ATPase subunit [Verrucomicrobiota bacterium]